MDLSYIFDRKYSAKERRSLLTKEYVVAGLRLFNGSRQATAEFLGVSRKTVRDVVEQHDDVFDEFPPRFPDKRKEKKVYEDKPERYSMDRNEKRKFKSILKEKYKIKGKEFNTISEIAIYYNLAMYEAELWIKNRMTEDRDFIRIISVPVDKYGNEIDVKDFEKLGSLEYN